ncbi:iron-siderophore ABC transporter substrate-binding protein [Glutamicibacter protophormiae]|uniref:ABC transporter substrate-binding protein n=1 Tax=Glutamicibacter protophormiae TaxID=37930 RepID=UPI002A81F126|nr:iron-siderophore ABC transporter substrate-binding protein [Glutamicibacter protophormiae]WPR66431.1 iron-siderophore ABC transporter substrate-binding protein [Glutamicibacter protophormiae]WPR69926.1 iron-siderophore ABC transporter substrate-binding protein [Glutamicibacter protophormiae]
MVAATAGCGAATSTSDSNAGNKDVAVGGQSFTTADAETAKFGSDAEAGQFPRTVTHANGTTEIPAKPQRVVVLDTGELDAVLSLGITPVGIPSTEGANSVPSYLADEVKDAKTVGTIQELNLEAIAALNPDLIIGSQLRADKLYSQLNQIAPTVFSIRPGFPWKENFLLAGESLGEETKAVSALNDYQTKATALNEDVEGDPKISLLRFIPEKIRLYANKSLIGVILADAGFSRPENQNIDDLAAEISAENLADADADWLFYTSYGTPEATGEKAAVEGPLWGQLQAVKDEQAIRVNDDVWFLGLGPTGANQILDDLRGYLVK